MLRYQVKTPHHDGWNAPGPDLLRPRWSVLDRTREILPNPGPWEARKLLRTGIWTNWREIGNRTDVGDYLQVALPTLHDNQLLQVGRPVGPGPYSKPVTIRAQVIGVPDLQNATPAAETAHALVRTRFPDVLFAGCYVCKRFNGSSDPGVGWSDHAWGDAIDEAQNLPAGVHNDDVFSWSVRMSRERLWVMEQAIGSRNDRTVTAEAPDWLVVDYDGDPDRDPGNSHLWHTHLSCHRHTGRPPCSS